jgi:hypothetical protein
MSLDEESDRHLAQFYEEEMRQAMGGVNLPISARARTKLQSRGLIERKRVAHSSRFVYVPTKKCLSYLSGQL